MLFKGLNVSFFLISCRVTELTAELVPELHHLLLCMRKEQHQGGTAPNKRKYIELLYLGCQ